jgi:hypothetical protein
MARTRQIRLKRLEPRRPGRGLRCAGSGIVDAPTAHPTRIEPGPCHHPRRLSLMSGQRLGPSQHVGPTTKCRRRIPPSDGAHIAEGDAALDRRCHPFAPSDLGLHWHDGPILTVSDGARSSKNFSIQDDGAGGIETGSMTTCNCPSCRSTTARYSTESRGFRRTAN